MRIDGLVSLIFSSAFLAQQKRLLGEMNSYEVAISLPLLQEGKIVFLPEIETLQDERVSLYTFGGPFRRRSRAA